MKLKKEQLIGVSCDTLSKNKKGNFVIRKGYYYRGETREKQMAEQLKKLFPNVNIVNTWDKFTAFRGGQSVAQGSHFGVEFNFNPPTE